MGARRKEQARPKKTAAEDADPAAALSRVLLSMKNEDEMRRFLADLCTPGEIRALGERWHVARLLAEGALSYREICEATGVSTATIVRVARFLRDERFGGYRLAMTRMKERA